eukprot:9989503-Alexandrium_andersonii.AAC.1
MQRAIRQLRDMSRPESFRWGCVSFYAKGRFALHCDCPRRSHRRKLPNGNHSKCSFSMTLKDTNSNDVIRMMKHW